MESPKKMADPKVSPFVRTMRLELIQANAHYPLKVACLPFHHVRRNSSRISPHFGTAKIAIIPKSANI